MKKTFRALIASVLAVMMIFSLAACGSKESGGNAAKPGSAGKTGGKEATPEFVYVSSFEKAENNNRPMGAACFTETGFYATSSDVVGQREPREGEVKEWEGQFDIIRESLEFVTYDGKVTRLSGYTPFEPEVPEGHNFNVELSSLATNADGELAALYHTSETWSDAPEGVTENDTAYWDYFQYVENWYLRTMDKTGAEKTLVKLNSGDSDEWFWPNGLSFVGDKILIAANTGLTVMGADGSSPSQITIDGYVNSIFTMKDGSLGIAYSDEMTGETKIAAIDPATGRVAQTWDGPRYAYSFFTGGGDYDLYYQSGINIYGFNLESGENEKLFDWLNVDVLSNNLAGFSVKADGSFIAVTNSWDAKYENVTTEFVTIMKKSYAEVPQKESLTLACQWADDALQEAVIRFNRSSNVRIEVIDYSQYNTDEDNNAGLNKLTTEIMSGSLPDILSLQGMPYQQLAAKGLLVDLYPFMDADSEISRDDFLPNVLQALEENGKLCSTVSTFNIVTLAGAAQIVGDKPGWTCDDVKDALAKMPEGCTVLDQFTTSGDILRDVLTLDADYYVDWTTGQCRFDSPEFADLLEFSRLFPNAFDSANFNWDEYQSDEARISEGKQLLTRLYLGSFDDIARTEAQFGGNLTYIGFPTASGVGSYLNVSSCYGISSSCADKEAAWQFLRGFMTEKGLENQNYYWGFPANRNLLEKQLKEAMTVEYEKDENGNYKLDPETGERVPIARGGAWIEGMDEPIAYYAVTQEQADKLMEVINTATKLYSQNTAVLDIICEQTDAFFAGQKTAEEVGKLVQGKMSIYVNEQR